MARKSKLEEYRLPASFGRRYRRPLALWQVVFALAFLAAGAGALYAAFYAPARLLLLKQKQTAIAQGTVSKSADNKFYITFNAGGQSVSFPRAFNGPAMNEGDKVRVVYAAQSLQEAAADFNIFDKNRLILGGFGFVFIILGFSFLRREVSFSHGGKEGEMPTI